MQTRALAPGMPPRGEEEGTEEERMRRGLLENGVVVEHFYVLYASTRARATERVRVGARG